TPSSFHCSAPIRYLHSFPTRRSSDLLRPLGRKRERNAGADPHRHRLRGLGGARGREASAGGGDRDARRLHAVLGAFRGAALLLRSEEHTSELQSRFDLVCRLLLEKKK